MDIDYDILKEIYSGSKWNHIDDYSKKTWVRFLNKYIYDEVVNVTELSDKINNIGIFLKRLQDRSKKLITESELQLYELSTDIALNILDFYNQQYHDYPNDDGFQYYPELDNPLFNSKIYLKKEFRYYEYPPMTNESFHAKPPKKFKRTPTQSFVRNYIYNHTPYNGILLWHGVGVGKT